MEIIIIIPEFGEDIENRWRLLFLLMNSEKIKKTDDFYS